MVTDPDRVTRDFEDVGLVKQTLMPEEEFWANEYTPGKTPPQHLTDLIIYELHVGSLGLPFHRIRIARRCHGVRRDS